MKTFNKAKSLRELENKMNDNFVECGELLEKYDNAVCNRYKVSEAKEKLIHFIMWQILPVEMLDVFLKFNMNELYKDQLIGIIRKFHESKK